MLAKMAGSSDHEKKIADRLKSLEKYTALFFGEGRSRPATVLLQPESTARRSTRSAFCSAPSS